MIVEFNVGNLRMFTSWPSNQTSHLQLSSGMTYTGTSDKLALSMAMCTKPFPITVVFACIPKPRMTVLSGFHIICNRRAVESRIKHDDEPESIRHLTTLFVLIWASFSCKIVGGGLLSALNMQYMSWLTLRARCYPLLVAWVHPLQVWPRWYSIVCKTVGYAQFAHT